LDIDLRHCADCGAPTRTTPYDQAGLGSHRELFEIPRDIAYLNNASYTPLPRVVREAGEMGVARKSHPWTMGRDEAEAEANAVRAAAARLIGAAAADIAIVNSAAYGVATAVANIAIEPGDRILMIAGEFPSLAHAWARLAEERGAVLDIVERPTDGDWTGALEARIAAPGRPVAVAALTPTVWTDGTMIDLMRLVPGLRAQGAAIVVDATQSAGVLPIDVAALGADFLMFPTYKWLLGPYTLAFLYVAPHRQGGRPIEEFGAIRQGGAGPFAGQLGPLVAGAGRFDMGQRLNPVSLPMALAGMRLLDEWGREALVARMRHTTDALAEAAEAAGLVPVARARRAPHVLGLQLPGSMDAAAFVAGLERHGVYVAERGGTVRVGAHVFNDEDDVTRFGAAVMAGMGAV
jgi:selenocysteine lyase/cysteine desulfurase